MFNRSPSAIYIQTVSVVLKVNYLFPYGKSNLSTFLTHAIRFVNRYSGGGTRRLACVLIIARRSAGSAGVISNSRTAKSSFIGVGM